MNQFFGKYRGKVVNNLDPMSLGRVQVRVPAVLGDGRSSWAMPCAPYAGPGVGLFTIPPNDANVWVEFEGGDPDYPIWSGCFWGSGDLPAMPATPDVKILKTAAATLKLDDTPGAGGITIETGGMQIVLDASGVAITNGKGATIKLSANQISLNDGALEVM